MFGNLIGGIVGKIGNRNANTFIAPQLPKEKKQDNTMLIVASIVIIALFFLMINNK